MKKNNYAPLAFAVTLALFGCSSNKSPEPKADDLTAERDSLSKSKPFIVSNMPYAKKKPLRMVNAGDNWLRTKSFALSVGNRSAGVPFSEILKAFQASGINIVSTLPLDGMMYAGVPIMAGTTADTAVRLLTEQMGLDYQVEFKSGSTPFVRITEMGTTHYRLQVPDVITSLSMTSPVTLGQQTSGSGSQSGTSGQSQGGQSQMGGSQGQSGGQGGQSGQQGSQSGGVITSYQTAFWEKLEKELKDLLAVSAPVASASTPTMPVDPNMQMRQGVDYVTDGNIPQAFAMQQQAFGQSSASTPKIGRVTVNSATGNISITAPRHVRDRVVVYLKDIDSELNTRMSVQARIVSVTRAAEETSGIDIAGFKQFASDKYGLSVTNNVLGNVSIGTDGIRSASASDALTQSLIGVTKVDSAFQAFFAYLESQGNTQAVSHLEGAGSSGRTMIMRQIGNDPVLRNSTSQVTTDGGNTVGGSSSTIDQNYTGTSAKITPVYNPKRGVINTIVDIDLVLDAGEKPQVEQIVAGDQIKANTVVLKKQNMVNVQTQTVARAGEVIIAGSIRTIQQVDSSAGITGLKDSLVGDLFGKERKRTLVTDYFVLLSVDAQRYDAE